MKEGEEHWNIVPVGRSSVESEGRFGVWAGSVPAGLPGTSWNQTSPDLSQPTAT